jgi:hypothetical protein
MKNSSLVGRSNFRSAQAPKLSRRNFRLRRFALVSDARRGDVPLYYFKLVDSIIVADHGVHELVDDDAARVEAIKLALSIRETRPELRGQHYSISVTAQDGAGVCVIPLDET